MDSAVGRDLPPIYVASCSATLLNHCLIMVSCSSGSQQYVQGEILVRLCAGALRA